MRDDYSVRSRLEDILGSETRKAVAKHELIELAHTKKGREPAFDQPLAIAERFRSEGDGEAAKIIGDKEKDLQRIEPEAYRGV